MRLVLTSYWRSSCSFRVRLVLAAKGISYETRAVNLLTKEQRGSSHLARSPTGFVPCLEIDGTPYQESVAIVELVEELFRARPLLPAGPEARARVRALVEVVNAGTQPLQNLHVLEHLSGDAATRNAWAHHFISRGLDAFERMIALHEGVGFSGRYSFGDTLTLADCFLLPQVYNARRCSVSLEPYARIRRALETLESHHELEPAFPERQPDRPENAVR